MAAAAAARHPSAADLRAEQARRAILTTAVHRGHMRPNTVKHS